MGLENKSMKYYVKFGRRRADLRESLRRGCANQTK